MSDNLAAVSLFAALDAVDSAILITDARRAEQPIVYANPAFERLTGYPPEAVRGRNYRFLLGDDHDQPGLASVQAAMREGRSTKAVLRSFRKDGSPFWNELAISPIRDETGGISHFVTVQSDVTAARRHEQDVREADEAARRADAAKLRFLSAASHDLRQPLQAMSLLNANLAEILRGGEAQQMVRDMDDALTIAAGILDALLEISELDSGAVEPSLTEFPIDRWQGAIHDGMAMQAAAAGVDLRVLPCGLWVRSDRLLLRRIVENLVANALQHAEAGKVLLGCRRRGDRLRIEIWDNGIGVPPAEIEPIFEEYHQIGNPARDRRRGLGLGLAVVRRLAALLDHPLEVSSAMGRHSMFAVTVPRVPSASNPPAAGRGTP